MSIAQNPLSVEVTLPREDIALFTVAGYLDVDTSTELRHHLANQFHHGRRHFLLDLSAVPFMDSSGMNIIVRAYQQARESGGSVHIIAPVPAVQRILDLTGVSITVPISGTVEESLALVEKSDATDTTDTAGGAGHAPRV
ncbi:STAS domain-containing protein [Streptomyces fructofermentans]|uniref:Anti-sigma factor antagonist n=1 Tax=Streptomyces fructofermentans TaxID=152141 RepID=A0A918NPM0_9ACTN|nr:STAS domain-containing protein [Streptomyces fructofermentans]GGX85258.1 anti-sigma factor antagonist [Streptomyces fructofermentans]